MKKLEALLTELENKIPKQEVMNLMVSKSSVGWHIEHSLLTFNLIIETLKKSNPKDYKWTFNFMRTLVFAMNKIPRGKAKAPDRVQPKTLFSKETLENHIYNSKQKLKELEGLHRNSYFPHPYFNLLNLKPTIRFLSIHTKHHINIINDILKSKEN